MEMTSPLARPFARRSTALPSLGGAALLALGLYAAVALKQPILAAVAGAAGLALLRWAWAERPFSAALIAFDAAAFAIFAVQRNDSLGFWQLPGPWADVWRFDPPGATIALIVYAGGSIMALVSAARGLRLIEAVSLIAIPFLFNLLVTVGADWRMAGLGAVVTGGAKLPFPVQVAIGRALILWGIGEAILTLINLVSVNRLPRSARAHGLFALSGAVAALSPLVANAAQWVVQPLLAIVFSSACAALAQAGLWAIVYLFTGVMLDWLGGRPPRFETVWEHWRTGFVKGAIYGALFIGFVLIAALILRAPGAEAILSGGVLVIGPLGGALLFPLGATILGSADGTAPFFGRLGRAYRNPRGFARGAVVGLGLALAYLTDLSADDGGTRFLAMAAIGALAYGGVDLAFDGWSVLSGGRTKLPSWRLYALGLLLGGIVAGALGWYFDAPQLKVVVAKFWAYADVNYRLDGRRLGDFTTYPIFNKYGSINLGEVAGGVRLFWAESVAGVINWSLAAPLFSINYVLLDAGLQRSSEADQDPLQSVRDRGPGRAGGARPALGPVDGADHQFVPAPVAGSDLVQSGRRDPLGGRDRQGHDAESGRLPPVQPDALSRPARLRLAAHPHLVRPYGAQGRDPGQSVVSRRRSRRRGGGPVRRPSRAHARHSGRHSPLRHLGAAAHPLLHPARL